MTDRELIARIARSAGGRAGYKQLVRELGLGGGRERRLLLEQLARLTARGRLVKIDREQWSLSQTAAARDNLAAGRLDMHRDGYGFVRPNARQEITGDIFIPPNEIGNAMQGDQVLVEVEPPKADGRRQGRIVRILTRHNPTVVGTFHYARPAQWSGETEHPPGWHTVTPFDERMTQPIFIPPDEPLPEPREAPSPHRVLGSDVARHASLEGLIVDVEITRWPTPTRPPLGRVVEVLGSPDDFGVDVEMMIRKHQLPRVFPEDVLAEARAVAHLEPKIVARRADFRSLPIVTIDGETARDFDDAVLVTERIDSQGDMGYELQVHIADVAEYVTTGSALDREARLRGTSVYFPDRAIPMLPHELSSGICSLRPREDRLVLSCILQLDSAGRIESYEILEGVICSAARMTYTEVHAILEGDEETRDRYENLVPAFERMRRLAMLMNKRREERGSIDFDLPEPVIQFDEHGQMSGVTRAERTWANRLIEEFMLAANECVATWLEDLGVPSLYRIHEKPEPRRVVQFEELAASFGFSLGLGPLPVKRMQFGGERREMHGRGRNPRTHEVPEDIAVTPRMYQKLAAKIEGKPEERILSYLMLRSLMQARYSEINEGHFALAAPTYTHFTSPIRRYPDLIVHRIAKALLRAGVEGKGELAEDRLSSPWSHPNEALDDARVPHLPRAPRKRPGRDRVLDPPIPEAELAQIAEETSQTERRAAEAERELVEWKKVRFMQDRVGEEFGALVLNPTKYGLFVELTDLFVEGLVPIDSMRGDRYTWRENTHEIVGEHTGRIFRAGDRVQVILDRILHQERRLQFSLVEEGIPLTGKRPPKPSKKSKKKRGEKGASGPSFRPPAARGKKPGKRPRK
ncbi:MAG: ribonuclease R family protein [Acidobacteriota bacterium]